MGYDVFAHKQTVLLVKNHRPSRLYRESTAEIMNFLKKVFGQLVMLGFDIAVFTPASYQRHRL